MQAASYSDLEARVELLEAKLSEFLSRATEAESTTDLIIAAGCAQQLPAEQELAAAS